MSAVRDAQFVRELHDDLRAFEDLNKRRHARQGRVTLDQIKAARTAFGDKIKLYLAAVRQGKV